MDLVIKTKVDCKPLVSGLVFFDEVLKPEEIIKYLLKGYRIKLKKAPIGVNFYLENNELKSEKISYLKGIPQTWFNPDIKYVIDYD